MSYSRVQFSKDIGIVPLKTLMGILQDLVTKLQDFQEATNSEPAPENSQEGSDRFLEINQSSTVEANKERVCFYSDFYLDFLSKKFYYI